MKLPFRKLKMLAGYGLYFLMEGLGFFHREKRGNILLINVNGIGDVVVSTSVLQSVRNRFPDRRVAFVTHKGAADAVRGNPLIEEVYVHQGMGAGSLLGFMSFCRRFRPEYVLSMNPGYKNALLACFAPASKRVWFLREDRLVARVGSRGRIETVSPGNIADYAHIAAEMAGCSCDRRGLPRIFISEPNRIALSRIGAKPLVLFVGGKWAWKKWDSERFAELVERLYRDRLVVVCGGKGDEDILERVRKQAGAGKGIEYILVENVQQLASVICQGVLLVTTDTVALHVATAVGIRAVALFGPTDPARVLAEGAGHTVLSKTLPCRPCYSVIDGKGRCDHPISSHCLKSITAEEVVSAIGRML